jgi:hypothetical protein
MGKGEKGFWEGKIENMKVCGKAREGKGPWGNEA